MSEEEVTRIVGALLRDGYVRRADAPEMTRQDVQEEVRRRLREVGLDLLLSPYSDAWGACLNEQAAQLLGPDWLENQGLQRNALALIVVLWSKLILPRRIIQDKKIGTVGQQPLPGMELALQQVEEGKALTVSLDQLYADFGKRFGAKGRLSGLLTQLKNLGIIEFEQKNEIHAGPMLDVILPGPLMRNYIEREMRAVLVRDADFSPAKLPEMKGGPR
jgi:hypothetical protein